MKKKCKKTGYPSKNSALKAIEKIESEGEKRLKTPCRYYYCDECQKYHLTSLKSYNNPACDLKYLEEWNKLINNQHL